MLWCQKARDRRVEAKILKEEDGCFKCARREACRRFPVLMLRLIVLKERTLHV